MKRYTCKGVITIGIFDFLKKKEVKSKVIKEDKVIHSFEDEEEIVVEGINVNNTKEDNVGTFDVTTDIASKGVNEEVSKEEVSKSEWCYIDVNQEAEDKIKERYPNFNPNGLQDEIITFLDVYMMYIESNGDDKYFNYTRCSKEVETEMKCIYMSQKLNITFDKRIIKGYGITGFSDDGEKITITTEVAIYSLNNGGVKAGGLALSIPQQLKYEVDFTIYTKEFFGICKGCSSELEQGEQCTCGETDKKILNKKLITRIKPLKGV